MNILKTRKKVNDLLLDLKVTKRTCREERRKFKEAKTHLAFVKEAQEAAQKVAEEIQQKAHKKISSVVSRSLETVFAGDDIYGFKIRFDRKRGRTEAVLILTKNGHEVEDPLNADSGGVVDVAAFVLRTSCIVLSKPSLRRFLSLDEPFKFVRSPKNDLLPKCAQMLKEVSQMLGLQIILVTHSQELSLVADTSYVISQVNGVSIAKKFQMER